MYLQTRSNLDAMDPASCAPAVSSVVYRLWSERGTVGVIEQLKLAGIVLLIGLAVVLLLAAMSDYASGACGAMTPRAGGARVKPESGSRSLYTVTHGRIPDRHVLHFR